MMNKILTVAALTAALVLPVVAQAKVGTEEFCGAAHGMAFRVATARDKGVPLSDMLKEADTLKPEVAALVKTIVMDIYGAPEQSPTRAAALTLKACQSALASKASL